MLSIELVGDKALQARMAATPSLLRTFLTKAVKEQTLLLEAHVKDDKLSGQVLHVQTGNLRASIHSTFESSSTEVTGKVSSSGDVKYAAIHEYGGTIMHPGGTPYMMFQGELFFVSLANAKNLNLPVTKAHVINMPERSFMRSALADRKDDVIQALQLAANQGVAEGINGT